MASGEVHLIGNLAPSYQKNKVIKGGDGIVLLASDCGEYVGGFVSVDTV